MKIGFGIFILFFTISTQAEYRVFELLIQNTQTKEERTLASTLDPFQYPGYYDIKKDETVLYTSTWMCWGDTSYHTPLCPNPNPNPSPTQSPAQK